MRVLIVHNRYQQAGGEDTVVANEHALRLSLALGALLRRPGSIAAYSDITVRLLPGDVLDGLRPIGHHRQLLCKCRRAEVLARKGWTMVAIELTPEMAAAVYATMERNLAVEFCLMKASRSFGQVADLWPLVSENSHPSPDVLGRAPATWGPCTHGSLALALI